MPKLRRAVAWFVDFALVVALASALAVLTFHRISALVTDVPELATRGGLDLLASRGDMLEASQDLGLSLWNKSVLYVEQAFGLLVLTVFLYQWACLALAGRTVGKALVGLKVSPRLGRVRKVPSSARRAGPAASGACSRRAGWSPSYWMYLGVRPVRRECVPGVAGQAGLCGHGLGRRAVRRAAVTTAADVAVYAVACVLLVEGQVVLSVLVWAVAVVLFLLNALPVLSPGRRSLADRVAGTAVSGVGFSTPVATPLVRTS
ncbi:RDD family protein [Streptomyces violaceus]|uniref:RDD family protein n=1 Tax=Streptomyces violaceus TaxID=1936 RepID=A0ABY9UF70_STRVL|nr:RDD family protein [Streptomyces janthinus]WND21508.1 RDD family protein [Streptomyces janthinus]